MCPLLSRVLVCVTGFRAEDWSCRMTLIQTVLVTLFDGRRDMIETLEDTWIWIKFYFSKIFQLIAGAVTFKVATLHLSLPIVSGFRFSIIPSLRTILGLTSTRSLPRKASHPSRLAHRHHLTLDGSPFYTELIWEVKGRRAEGVTLRRRPRSRGVKETDVVWFENGKVFLFWFFQVLGFLCFR